MTDPARAIEIRGNMYTLMSLVLASTDHALIARSLHERVQQAPGFLFNIPVIVDFSSVSVTGGYNFNLLFKLIRQQSLLPVAVRGLPEHLQERLQAAGVPVVEMTTPRSGMSIERSMSEGKGKLIAEPGVTLGRPGETLLIDRPLRSGERCYAQQSDLIVIGDSLPDTELIADGHIHIYGALRGKVAAGFQGDKTARIYCRTLAAQMVSIAGVGSTTLTPPRRAAGTLQIYLKNDVLIGDGV